MSLTDLYRSSTEQDAKVSQVWALTHCSWDGGELVVLWASICRPLAIIEQWRALFNDTNQQQQKKVINHQNRELR